jgi:hypothetical protein
MMQEENLVEPTEDQIEDNDSEQENQDLDLDDNDRDDQDQENQNEDSSEDGEDLIVTIGDGAPTQNNEDDFHGKPAPAWVKELRQREREQRKELRELKKQLEQQQKPQQKEITLSKKPKLEDFDYDADEYEKARDAWDDEKRLFERQEERKRAEQEEVDRALEKTYSAYKEKAKALNARDFDDAEYEVQEKFSTTQQGIILTALDDPAKFVYVIGKSPEKLKELASINDPLKFAVAAAKLETQMKVTKRKAATQPERTIKGSESLSGTIDSTYEKLLAKAEKTGNRTEVIRYLREKKLN